MNIRTAALLAIIAQTAMPAQAAATGGNPNVVYIIMDDLGYGDIGCFGQKKTETPNIDALSEHGMMFTQHYCGSPVSAPSRCVLMTGLHSGHAQIRDNNELASRGAVNDHESMYADPGLEGQAPLREGTLTLGHLMRKAGYVTGCFGKWGLGYPGSEGEPLKQGFDRFVGYNCQRQAHTYYPPFLYSGSERMALNNRVMNPHKMFIAEGEDPLDERNYERFYQKDYANDIICDSVLAFVESNRDRPFFLMWTTPLPHVSLMAPKEWVDHYVRKFGDEQPYSGNRGYASCRYPHATYAAMVSYFDHQVGELVEKLKSLGIYDNTLIIFTSDNGPTFNGGSDSPWFESGGPFKSEYGWGKCFMHEGGIRVPTIMVWEGHIKPGTTTEHISAFQDVMPTLAELVGAEIPVTDGISFLPTLLGQKDRQQTHDYLYWEYPDPYIGNRAIRMGKWKGIITNINKGNDVMQLYDLDADPREEHDLAADHPDVVERMRTLMAEAHEPYERYTLE